MVISVVIPTYNPNIQRLNMTLDSLKKQTLSLVLWELIIVDNNSSFNFDTLTDTSWHPSCRLLFESKQGLTFARLKGFTEAKGLIIVMVDDDNVLNADYLEQAQCIFNDQRGLGAAGGKSIPLFEFPVPGWISPFYGSLALRDLGEKTVIEKWGNKYPNCAPIGAGMVVRKAALQSYIAKILSGKSTVMDRTGTSLSSGGDNDIVLEILKSGWTVAYYPSLVLEHIIPPERTQFKYLAKLVNNTNNSWVKLLSSHQINPWPLISAWSAPLRKIKAWFTYKAWKSKVNYINWRGACGTFDGLIRKQ